MAKVKGKSTAKGCHHSKEANAGQKLTLAHLTVSWETRLDTRRADGRVLAWLLLWASHLTGNLNLFANDGGGS
jgi:hypothetical protein